MSGTDYGKLALGVAVWAAVALFAVFVQATVEDQLIGFFPVLAAVIVAWAVGEYVVHPEERDARREGS